MSNHTSPWETVAQFLIFPPQVWVLKRELLWIIIFPEGTRVVAGETRKFGVSGALLAIATGKSVVPLRTTPARSGQGADS